MYVQITEEGAIKITVRTIEEDDVVIDRAL